MNMGNSKWLFGYGSLLWKVDFEYKSKVVGYVKNYKRQFWLLSDDHRGTPESPGRVVTLVQMAESENATVLGIAYEIEESKVDATFKHLDFREKCGYSKHEVDFYALDDQQQPSIKCTCYYADSTNAYYSKTLDNDYIAQHIIKSVGPSGTNLEYFFNLCNTIRHLLENKDGGGKHREAFLKNEQHLFEIESIIRSTLAQSSA